MSRPQRKRNPKIQQRGSAAIAPTTTAAEPGASSTLLKLKQWSAPFCVAIATILLGWRFFSFINQYAVDIFFYDEWDFMHLFFDGSPHLSELFRLQHGPHREGAGLVADWFLYQLTGWNVRAESFFIGGCIFAASLLALQLKRKLFGHFRYADILIPAIFLTLAQFETLTGTPNAAYSAIPLLLILTYCLALTHGSTPLRYLSLLVLNFLLIYTGFGIFMGVVTVGVFGIEVYWSLRRQTNTRIALPLIGLAIAAASLASFFWHWVFTTAVDCEPPRHAFIPYIDFVALMFARFTALTAPLILAQVAGAFLLLTAVVALAFQVPRLTVAAPEAKASPGRSRALITAVLLSFSFLFSANTAAGRVCLGLPNAAYVSRYATLLIPGFLGMYFALISIPIRPIRSLTVGCLSVLLVFGLTRFPVDARMYADGKRKWVDCYRKTESVAYCDDSTRFKVYPEPERTNLKQKLDYLKQHRLSLFRPTAAHD